MSVMDMSSMIQGMTSNYNSDTAGRASGANDEDNSSCASGCSSDSSGGEEEIKKKKINKERKKPTEEVKHVHAKQKPDAQRQRSQDDTSDRGRTSSRSGSKKTSRREQTRTEDSSEDDADSDTESVRTDNLRQFVNALRLKKKEGDAGADARTSADTLQNLSRPVTADAEVHQSFASFLTEGAAGGGAPQVVGGSSLSCAKVLHS